MQRKLALLISCSPGRPNFVHAVRLAQTAIDQGVEVYVYCIDDAVTGINEPLLQSLTGRGLRLYACAYSAERRRFPRSDAAIFAGLASLSDLIADTDRFVSFN